MSLAAKWTDDCGGKKDYDGDIISISTRYWPANGGFYVLDAGGEFKPNEVLAKPSATSSLLIWADLDDAGHHGEYRTLAEAEFEGETFEEVAAQVEAWAQATTDRAIAALEREFGVAK